MKRQCGLIVAGTDTGIGKTVVAALLMAVTDSTYWKPVQAGTDEETDSQAVRRISGCTVDRIHPEAYRLRSPMSPDQAAAIDGVIIEREWLQLPHFPMPLIIECAGGLMVPLNADLLQIEMIVEWALPVVLVARTTLGTLNHVMLSIEAMERRRIEIAGIVLTGPEHQPNVQSLSSMTRHPILGRIPPLEHIDHCTLLDAFGEHFPHSKRLLQIAGAY